MRSTTNSRIIPMARPCMTAILNRELYRIFLNLSLLRLPLAKEGKEIPSSEKEEKPLSGRYLHPGCFPERYTAKLIQTADIDYSVCKKESGETGTLATNSSSQRGCINFYIDRDNQYGYHKPTACFHFIHCNGNGGAMRSYLQSHAPKIDWLNVVTSVQLILPFEKLCFSDRQRMSRQTEADNIRATVTMDLSDYYRYRQ